MTWREFTKGKMGKYMRSGLSHGETMKRLGKEWKEYQAKHKSAFENPIMQKLEREGKIRFVGKSKPLHHKVHRRAKKKLWVKSKERDKAIMAERPGKRRSKSGKTYYEYRLNRDRKSVV